MCVPSKGMEPVSAERLRNNGKKAFMSIKQNWYHHFLFKTSFAEIKELFPEKNQTLREIFYKIQVMAKIIYFFGFR